MIFYLFIFLVLLFFSKGKYVGIKSFIPHFILFLLIALKGQVGCDFTGYLHRYQQFNVVYSLERSTGEYGWYLVEYLTHVNGLSYQTYTIAASIIGISFLFLAQKKIQYIGFLFFIYQMIIVQLGLSGMRQFIAVCVLTYATTIYLFGNQKSILKFLLLIIFAASFHISAIAMLFVLPFIHKLKKSQIVFIVIICIVGLSSDIIGSAGDKYDSRYLEGSSVSSGAWLRFIISCFILILAMAKAPKKLYNLGLTIIFFGIFLGVVNSIALHRFNYYFLPIVCLLLIKNYKSGNVSMKRMHYVYALSAFYFLFWFTFSKYSECFIPYNVF